MYDDNFNRPVAVYEFDTRRLVVIFPNWEACKSVLPFGPGPFTWNKYIWLYADENIGEILGDIDECPEPAQLHVGDEGIITCN